MKELAFPTNTSWKQFKGNWRNVTRGGLRYIACHPFSWSRVVVPRLRFALCKTSLKCPVTTPEGFVLRTNSELLVYTQIFIERNLAYRPLLKNLRGYPNPVIIDVGYNCGFVTKWLYGYNETANFYGIEVLEQNINRSQDLEREMFRASFQSILNEGFAPKPLVFHKAAWSFSGGKVPVSIGNRVGVGVLGHNTFELETMAVDDIPVTAQGPSLSGPIFLLKIDTDGSNLEVLRGAKDTLSRCRWLLIEEDPGVLEYCQLKLKNWSIHRLTNCNLVLKNQSL